MSVKEKLKVYSHLIQLFILPTRIYQDLIFQLHPQRDGRPDMIYYIEKHWPATFSLSVVSSSCLLGSIVFLSRELNLKFSPSYLHFFRGICGQNCCGTLPCSIPCADVIPERWSWKMSDLGWDTGILVFSPEESLNTISLIVPHSHFFLHYQLPWYTFRRHTCMWPNTNPLGYAYYPIVDYNNPFIGH